MGTHFITGLAVAMAFVARPAGAAERSPGRGAQPFALTMAMAGPCAVADEIIAQAQAEAQRIWSRADVAISWVSPSEVPYASSGTDWLLVRCGAAATLPTNPDEPSVLPIAAIRFIGLLPANTIVMSPENADALLQQDARDGRDPRGWAVPFRRIRLGRLLGRAIAHEIGHFLTQSRAHTRGGLMRATHSVAALTGVSLGPFRVDAEQVTPLRLARGAAPPPGS